MRVAMRPDLHSVPVQMVQSDQSGHQVDPTRNSRQRAPAPFPFRLFHHTPAEEISEFSGPPADTLVPAGIHRQDSGANATMSSIAALLNGSWQAVLGEYSPEKGLRGQRLKRKEDSSQLVLTTGNLLKGDLGLTASLRETCGSSGEEKKGEGKKGEDKKGEGKKGGDKGPFSAEFALGNVSHTAKNQVEGSSSGVNVGHSRKGKFNALHAKIGYDETKRQDESGNRPASGLYFNLSVDVGQIEASGNADLPFSLPEVGAPVHDDVKPDWMKGSCSINAIAGILVAGYRFKVNGKDVSIGIKAGGKLGGKLGPGLKPKKFGFSSHLKPFVSMPVPLENMAEEKSERDP